MGSSPHKADTVAVHIDSVMEYWLNGHEIFGARPPWGLLHVSKHGSSLSLMHGALLVQQTPAFLKTTFREHYIGHLRTMKSGCSKTKADLPKS